MPTPPGDPAGHRLGFAVKVLGEGGLPSHDTRRWASEPHLRVSLERFADILGYLERTAISMYRLSSDFVPYGTHPDHPQFHGQLEECEAELAAAAERVAELGIRLSLHPGQYAVLNSEREEVVAAAARDVDQQAGLLDSLGAGAEGVIVLHVGGAAGGKEAAVDRFLRGFESLSERAQRRLVIENDDRTYSTAEVLAISERTGAPVVWDALHHRCLNPEGMTEAQALDGALATWPDGVVPKIHFSTPKTAMETKKIRKGRRVEHRPVLPDLRAHADLIDPISFGAFLAGPAKGRRFDVMLEAKGKDLALLRLRTQLEDPEAQGGGIPQ